MSLESKTSWPSRESADLIIFSCKLNEPNKLNELIELIAAALWKTPRRAAKLI